MSAAVSVMTPEQRIHALESSLAACRSMAKDLLNGWPARELCAPDPNAELDRAADLLGIPEGER